jgi:hypothetical protein
LLPPSTSVRTVAWAVAILGLVATALTLVLALNLTGAPPAVDESADFPTRILAGQAFEQSRWPLDLVANLMFAATFGSLILLGAILTSRTDRPEIAALLGAGGLLGIGSQLLYVGAHQVATSIGYCDCGFITQEVISQAWSLMVADGIAAWFLTAALILLAGGVAYTARALAGSAMPASWGALSWGLGALLVLGAALSIIGFDGQITSLLIAVISGIVLPIWAVWLAVGLTDDTVAAPLPVPA